MLTNAKFNHAEIDSSYSIKLAQCDFFNWRPTARKFAPSIAPVVPKVQQDPQMAWSFTGVTAPGLGDNRFNELF